MTSCLIRCSYIEIRNAVRCQVAPSVPIRTQTWDGKT